MDKQRLLFAMARGARIQVIDDDNEWYTTSFFAGLVHHYRIHPSDAHLEYGPLSSALRESALHLELPDSEEHEIAMRWLGLHYDFQADDFREAKLVFAEYLADLGV